MSIYSRNQPSADENAVLLDEVPDCNDLIQYVKAIGSIIGPSHIDSVVKYGSKIKLFLKEKKYVDYVIGSAIVLQSHHTKVEFAVTPTAHVLMLNLDPIVPDDHVTRVLSPFGTFKSRIIHPTVSADPVYAHIQSGERQVYMKLFDNIQVPDSLNIEYDGETYFVSLRVEAPKQAQSPSPRISAVMSNVACVNPIQDGQLVMAHSEELDSVLEKKEIKVDNDSSNNSENEDDMFDLFFEVKDWDSFLSGDLNSEAEQLKSHNKVPTKPSANVCSVKPMRTSLNCGAEGSFS